MQSLLLTLPQRAACRYSGAGRAATVLRAAAGMSGAAASSAVSAGGMAAGVAAGALARAVAAAAPVAAIATGRGFSYAASALWPYQLQSGGSVDSPQTPSHLSQSSLGARVAAPIVPHAESAGGGSPSSVGRSLAALCDQERASLVAAVSVGCQLGAELRAQLPDDCVIVEVPSLWAA